MGRKSSYFRHVFNAHNDDKIRAVIELGGVKTVGVYFILLEIYGDALNNDDSKSSQQVIPLRRIANATGLRSDSCRTCIELLAKCELIAIQYRVYPVSSVEVNIPNFLKYYGSYQKTTGKIKEKKIKEKKIKENKVIPEKKISGVKTWEAYSAAYHKRYGAAPVRDKKMNALMLNLTESLGVNIAPCVAEFYLTHNEYLYVKSMHCATILIRDAQKLHTEWKTNRKVTPSNVKAAQMKDNAQELRNDNPYRSKK